MTTDPARDPARDPVRDPAGDPADALPTGPDDRRRARSASPWEETIGFSRAVRVGATVHVAGSGPVWPDGSFDPDPEAQAARCLAIGADALADLDASLDDVVRTRMYVTSEAVIAAVGRAHRAALGHVAPAATLVIVAGLADPRWVVEIELDAVVRPSRD